MPERGTAGERLGRILYLLPLASRDGGVPLDEAAGALGVDAATVQDDLAEVTARAFYHPSGGADELQISIEADHITVFAGGKFARPPRLSPDEALAASLALRSAALEADIDRRPVLLDLAHRIDLELAFRSAAERDAELALDHVDAPGAGLRGLLRDAVHGGRRCRVTYLKPDGPGPSERELDPYLVVYGPGGWYVIGHCHARDQVRVFRLDRILAAELTDGSFDPPDSFEAAAYVDGGRVLRSDAEQEIQVRYSAKIAPWIRERGPCEDLDDGRVQVRYAAADPGWAVRHVLRYGPEAEVVAPEELREVVRDTLGAVAGSGLGLR